MTKQWNDYREVIIGQYKHQNKPLHEVRRIMEEKYKFKASCVTPIHLIKLLSVAFSVSNAFDVLNVSLFLPDDNLPVVVPLLGHVSDGDVDNHRFRGSTQADRRAAGDVNNAFVSSVIAVL